MKILQKAIEDCGGYHQFSAEIGEKYHTVYAWVKRGGRFPAEKIAKIMAVVRGKNPALADKLADAILNGTLGEEHL